MINKFISVLLWLTALIVPIFWFSRDLALLVLAPIILILYLVKIFSQRKIEIKKGLAEYLLLGLIIISLLSAYFSLDRYLSFWTWASWLGLIIFYFLAANNLKRTKSLLSALVVSGTIASLVFLVLQRNLLGSLTNLAAFAGVLIPIAFYLTIKKHKLFILPLILLAGIIAVINFDLGWNILLVSSIALLAVVTANKKISRAWLIVPILLLLLSLTWQLFDLGPIYNFDLGAEVSLGRESSWQIAQNTTRQNIKSALLGSGPGTFQYDFSQHRSPDFNHNALWNFRFGQANNHLMQMWAATGYLGLLIWLAMLLAGLIAAFRQPWLLAPWLALLVVVWYSPLSLALWLVFLVLFLLLIGRRSQESIAWKLPNKDLISSLGLVIGLIIIILFFGYLAKFYLASWYFQQGDFAKAIRYNPNQAIYYSALANQHINDALASSEQDKIAGLLAAGINASQKAVELSPNNAALWQARANIFKQARSFSPEANQWVITTLEQAIKLEPTNPVFYIDLAVAQEIAQNETAQENFEKAVELKPDLALAQYELGRFYYNQDEIDSAIKHLEAAVILNPDYANALFGLGLAYEKDGRDKESLQLMERVQELNPDNEEIAKKVKSQKSKVKNTD